jgi:hypothetical protein
LHTISKVIESNDTTYASVLAKMFNSVFCSRAERLMKVFNSVSDVRSCP